MPHRREELRKHAAECLALAQGTDDLQMRIGYVTLAQRLYDMAKSAPNSAGVPDRAVLNDEQMGRH